MKLEMLIEPVIKPKYIKLTVRVKRGDTVLAVSSTETCRGFERGAFEVCYIVAKELKEHMERFNINQAYVTKNDCLYIEDKPLETCEKLLRRFAYNSTYLMGV